MAQSGQQRSNPALLIFGLFAGIGLLSIVVGKVADYTEAHEEQTQTTPSVESTPAPSGATSTTRWVRTDAAIANMMGCDLPQHVDGRAVVTRDTCTDEQILKYRAYWNGGDTSPH